MNTVPEILADPQVAARGLVQDMYRRDGTCVKLLGFPAQLSVTPATCRSAPPRMGEDTESVLREQLGLDDAEIERLRRSGVVFP